MNIAPERLQEHGYYLFARFEFEELIDVISGELRRRTPHMVAYWALLAVFAAGALGTSVVVARSAVWVPFGGALAAVAGMIPVIPLHELLHALAFRIRGARRIRFGARLRYLMFYAIARDFVADYREMLFILYLPAAVISLAIVGAALILGLEPATAAGLTEFVGGSGEGAFVPVVVSALSWLGFIHWSACAGDAALASYMWRHRHLGSVTGDEGEHLVTSFYVRTPVGTAVPLLR